jgi:hypothetical protein
VISRRAIYSTRASEIYSLPMYSVSCFGYYGEYDYAKRELYRAGAFNAFNVNV